MSQAGAQSRRISDEILKNLSSIVLLADADGRITYANPAVKNILGYEIEEVLGDGWSKMRTGDPAKAEEMRAHIAAIARGERAPERALVNTIRHRNGEIRHILWQQARGPGNVAIGIGYDISELRMREEALHASEENYRFLFDNNPQPMWVFDLESLQILAVNQASIVHYGYSADEFLSMTILDLREERHVPKLLDALSKLSAGMAHEESVWQHRKKDGTLIDVATNAHTLEFAGRPARLVVAYDVTERLQAEQALKESEERYRAVTETASDAVVSMDEESTILFVNPAMERIFGYKRGEMLGKKMTMLIPPELREGHLSGIRRYLQSGGRNIPWSGYEVPGLHQNGTRIPLEVSFGETIRNGKHFFTGIMRDVSERKRAQEALRMAEKNYRSIFENAAEGIFQTTPDGKYISANPAMAAMMGFNSPQELIATRVDVGHQEYANPADRDVMVRELKERGVIRGFEYEAVCKDGSKIWVSEQIRAVHDENGRLSHYEGSVSDITERRRAENALRQSEASFRSLFENAPYGVLRATPEGRLLMVNPALSTMLGYGSAEDVVGTSILNFYFDPQERANFLAQVRSGEVTNFETRWKHKTGKPIRVKLGSRSVFESGALVYLETFVENVTEQRLLEDQFRQAQKMEAIGRLAGGVAHDFNNLLGVILGYAELALLKAEVDKPTAEKLMEIQKAGQRAATLTRQLLAFSRQQVLQPVLINLNEVIMGMEKLLRRLIGEDIDLQIDCKGALSRFQADPGQVEQVIMNLVVNARDAMPRGGRLSIETATFDADDSYARTHGDMKAGKYVVMAVSDTGEGMDAETQAHIFEPFFTTKEQGKGTGLGLATVYGIVKQSGGFIWVYSEKSHGTTFKLYFPFAAGTAAQQDSPTRSEAPLANLAGKERILLVEDEKPLRQTTREFLVTSGYTVLEASHAMEALAIARNNPGCIDLLLTDVVMPGMSGRQLSEELCSVFPGLRVLYMTGYTDDMVVHHGVLREGVSLVQKPFTRITLLKQVRKILDQEAKT